MNKLDFIKYVQNVCEKNNMTFNLCDDWRLDYIRQKNMGVFFDTIVGWI